MNLQLISFFISYKYNFKSILFILFLYIILITSATMNYINFYSSFLLLIPTILAFYKKYYVYGILLLILLITSLSIHSYKNRYTFLLDQIAIIFIVIYGAYLYYMKCISKSSNTRNIILQGLILLTFFITVYLYYYGYYTKQYCFDENKTVANLYHSLLHFISSYGFNIIIIM